MELISENEDPWITSYDLAFFLAFHNHEARPVDGCVQVEIDGATYNLIPNGNLPGLADLVSVA